MELSSWTTYDRTKADPRILPLGFAQGCSFHPHEGIGSRFRFISVGKGTGLFVRNGVTLAFRTPAYFCLNEMEDITLDCSDVTENRFIYFHPSLLRSDLDFQTLTGKDTADLPLDVMRDVYWLEPFLKRKTPLSGMILPGLGLAKRIDQLSRKMMQEAEEQTTVWWPCRTRSFLIEMLFAIITESDNAQAIESFSFSGNNELVRRFFLKIGADYSEPLTVDSLASELGTNRTSLQKQITQATGKTVGSCLTNVRLDAARLLICGTELPIGEIAERSGYLDSSAFIRSFRKVYGLTPTEYRKQNDHS